MPLRFEIRRIGSIRLGAGAIRLIILRYQFTLRAAKYSLALLDSYSLSYTACAYVQSTGSPRTDGSIKP